MIVVEGPDGAGKTTLCEWICNQFNLEMGQRSEKDRDKIYRTTREDTWNALHEECMATAPPKVWDRLGPYSDPIYSAHGIPIERSCAFTPQEIRAFHHMVTWSQFGLVILCMPPLSVVLENVRKKHQLDGVPEKTEGIYSSYEQMMPDTPRFDYARKGDRASVSIMISIHLKQRRERENLASGS